MPFAVNVPFIAITTFEPGPPVMLLAMVKLALALTVKASEIFKDLAKAFPESTFALFGAPKGIVKSFVAVGTPLGVQLQGLSQSLFTEPFHVIASIEVASCVHGVPPVP